MQHVACRRAAFRGLLLRGSSAVLVIGVAMGWMQSPIGSQTAPAGTIELVAQTSWHRQQEPFELRVRPQTTEDPASLELAVIVSPRLTSRSEFVANLDGRLRTSVIALDRTPLEQAPVDGDGAISLSINPQLGRDGVYPVRVELREKGGGDVLDSLATHLLHVQDLTEGDPLRVALVLPAHAQPAVQPDGSVRLSPRALEGMNALAGSLDATSRLPLTLAPTPETMEALIDSPREAERALATAIGAHQQGRQLLAGHYVVTNLSAMLDAGLVDEAAAQLRAGAAAVERAFGNRPDSRTWLSEGTLDDDSIAHLRDRQVDRVIVPEATLVPLTLPTTLTAPFVLEARGRRVQALASDNGMASHFLKRDDPVLAAHHLLADLAVVYFDFPGRSRGVVAAAPRSWRPTREFLDVLLPALEASPILAGATLEELFATVPPAIDRRAALVRRAAPQASPASPIRAADVRSARRRLDSFSSVLVADNDLDERIGRTLLVALTADFRPSKREAYLAGVDTQIEAQLGKVRMPQDRSVTLTAREGEIPVTISSLTGYPVRVVLRSQSETLEFPDGGRRPLELGGRTSTERIPVRARSSGSFPLRVRLESPDGSLLLAESRFTVRSTAASGVGIALSVGAASFLLVWWARHLRGRRSRALVPT